MLFFSHSSWQSPGSQCPMGFMKYCNTVICISREVVGIDFRCTLSHAVLSVVLEALVAYHIDCPCIIDCVFINLPKCLIF